MDSNFGIIGLQSLRNVHDPKGVGVVQKIKLLDSLSAAGPL